MLKIAYIAHYSELYGANRSLLDLVLRAKRLGAVQPFMFIPRPGPIEEVLQQNEIPYRVVEFHSWMSERQYMGRIHHRIGQHRRFEKAAKERWKANEQVVGSMVDEVRERGIDSIHANSSVAGIAHLLRERSGLPLVWHIRELPEKQYLLHIDKGKKFYAKALRSADKLIAITNAVKADIMDYLGAPHPIEVIYNGVLSTDQYQALKEEKIPRWENTSPFIFVLVGLIHPAKGQLEAVEALALVKKQFANVKLIIAGDGRDAELRQRIQALGLEGNVELTGFIKDPFTVFRRAHAKLMCSRNEAMGRVTIEAMGCGLPVIGHRSGGTPELIEHNVNGLLYEQGPADLANAMVALVRDPAAAQAMGERAAEVAAERFTIEKYTDQVLQVYAQVSGGTIAA